MGTRGAKARTLKVVDGEGGKSEQIAFKYREDAIRHIREEVNRRRLICTKHKVCRRSGGKLGSAEREIATELVLNGPPEKNYESYRDPPTMAQHIGLSHGTVKTGLIRMQCAQLIERKYIKKFVPASESSDGRDHHRHEYRVICMPGGRGYMKSMCRCFGAEHDTHHPKCRHAKGWVWREDKAAQEAPKEGRWSGVEEADTGFQEATTGFQEATTGFQEATTGFSEARAVPKNPVSKPTSPAKSQAKYKEKLKSKERAPLAPEDRPSARGLARGAKRTFLSDALDNKFHALTGLQGDALEKRKEELRKQIEELKREEDRERQSKQIDEAAKKTASG